MADVKILKVNPNQLYEEVDSSADSLQLASFKTANNELTDAKLGKLVDGLQNASDLHKHDDQYYPQGFFIGERLGPEDAGKPIVTDDDGYIDPSLIQFPAALDLSPYLKHDGSVALTGDLSAGGFKLTNLADPVLAGDATNKQYVDSIAVGLKPKGAVAAASTENIDVDAGGLLIIDGYQTVDGDRILVKDQTDLKENGIYEAHSGAWGRSPDQDNSPLDEIVNGVFVPQILNGDTQQNKPYFISSNGTGEDGVHIIGTDDIVWSVFTSPTQLQQGDAISIVGNIVSVDVLPNGGLVIETDALAVDTAYLAGEGLKDAGSHKLALDYSTTFDDAKPVKGEDLIAENVAVEDAGGMFTSDKLEGVLAEIGAQLTSGTGYPSFTSGAAGVAVGDAVYSSGADIVDPLSDLTQDHEVLGLSLDAKAASTAGVRVLQNDKVLAGVLGGSGVAGTRYYWDGTDITTTVPAQSGVYINVWMVGVAKNANDLTIKLKHIKKYAAA